MSKRDSQNLKGIAIIMIFMHNFCHWLPAATLENEYFYNYKNTLNWLNNIQNCGPYVFLNIFSFWGHYGVPIFLFLSGYGLVKKYESDNSSPLLFKPYMQRHFLKLWKLLSFAAIVQFVVYQGYMSIWLPILFTFTTNLIPNSDVIYGPWWFFSLIMQCYFFYAVCVYKKNNYILFIAISLSILLVISTMALDTSWQTLYYIKFNIFGWVTPFALGVLMARYNLKIPIWLILLSTFLFISCEFNKYAWAFSSIFVCFGIIPLIKSLNFMNLDLFKHIGGLSSMIFVVHPLTRRMTFYLLGHSTETVGIYSSVLFYIGLTLLSAWVYKLMLKRIN